MLHRPSHRPSLPGRAGGVVALVAASLLGLASLTGCAGGSGGSESDASSVRPDGDGDSGAGDAQVDSGVPPECLDAYPTAFGAPDLAEVTLMPAEWPADAAAGTLCQTAATGSGIQVASWATAASEAEVLDAIAAGLPASYVVSREDQGLGEQLNGSGDGVAFTVTTRPGAYDVAFESE